MFTLKVKMSPVTGPRALRLWLPVPPVCPLPVGAACGAGVGCVDGERGGESRWEGGVQSGVSLQRHPPGGVWNVQTARGQWASWFWGAERLGERGDV